MDTFNIISILEGNLKAFISLKPKGAEDDCWNMNIELFYDGKPAGRTEFTLHGYSSEEAEDVARNVRDNAFLMREIDEYLWGESD